MTCMPDSLRNGYKASRIGEDEPSQALINYPPSSYFSIDYMWLSVEPDFKLKRVSCRQQTKNYNLTRFAEN